MGVLTLGYMTVQITPCLGTAPVLHTVVAVFNSETIYRFLPPVAAKPWSGVKDVRKVANSCVQIKGTAFGNFSGEQVSTISTISILSTLKLWHNKLNEQSIFKHTSYVMVENKCIMFI